MEIKTLEMDGKPFGFNEPKGEMKDWINELNISHLPFNIVKQPKFISFYLKDEKLSNKQISLKEYKLKDFTDEDFNFLLEMETIYILDIFDYARVMEIEPEKDKIRIMPVWYKDLRWFREQKLKRILKKK